MRKIVFFFLLIFSVGRLSAQSENCSAATTLTVLANCSSPATGNTGATQNIPGCVGNADDDVWYQFVATSTSHQITVVPSAGLDPVVQLFSGNCSSLVSLSCMDNGLTGQPETIFASGLTIGATYRIRVYHYYTGGGSTTSFTICVTTPPPPPSNDACSNAITLAINSSCTYTNATSLNATQSLPGCVGTADDDVWFKFTATSSVHTITVDPSSNMDPVVQLYSGTGCGGLTSITCMDNGFTDGNEVINAVGLTVGNTYYIRVYDYYASSGGYSFQICVTGTPTPTPPNDEPCGAIQLPPVTSTCNFLNFSTVGATTSTGAGIPTPSSCAGGSPPQQGGFNNSPQPKDVWFAITVPSTGNVSVMVQPSYGMNDVVMALYSGTCSSLTQIACSDDYNYPSTANDMKPFINATGLTPGSTVYLRYWAFNGNTTGNIGFCVTTNTHDDCANALYICDINGYSGSTSAAFTTDRPCNMRGNAETATYTYTPGTCQPGGIFGLGGSWGVGAPNCDVRIDNNSWIKFTAANTSVTLNVSVYGCFVGNYPSGGIQMQIFSASSPCCGFTPVSDFKEGSSAFTITANNLTVGQDYYLMIDGFAGDICNYTITANSGVQFPDITASSNPICAGTSITLYGPPGATSYEWQPGGQTTQNITVSPATTTTYSLEVTGICGTRQTLTKTITVNQLPDLSGINNSITVCSGQTINLAASGGSSYQWVGPNSFNSTSQNPAILNSSADNAGTYTVTVTSAAGCTSSAQVQVTVNANPTPSISGTNVICAGQSTTFTSTAANAYLWNTGSTNQSINISNPGTYTVTVTDANGCTATATRTLTVNSNPTPVAFNNGPVCVGSSLQLNASGGIDYSWTGPNNFTSDLQNPTISNVTMANSGTYTVTVTDNNNCTASTTTTVNVVNNPAASITAIPDADICIGESVTLVANTSSGYIWSTGANTSSIIVSPNTSTYYSVTLTNPGGCVGTATASILINVNPLPTPTINSNSPVCGGSPIQLSASGGASYAWYGPNGFIGFEQNPSITNDNNAVSGIYQVLVTDANGCTASASVYVSIVTDPDLQLTASPNDSICLGQSVSLSVYPSSSYQWNNGSTDQQISVNPLSTTIYTVTVTDPFGICNGTVSDQIKITVIENPTAIASSNSPVCPRAEIQLSSSGGSFYQWAGPNGFTSTSANPIIDDAMPSDSGWYSVMVSNSFGCYDYDSTYVQIYDHALSLTANQDTASLLNSENVSVPILNNDLGSIGSFIILTQPLHGSVQINGETIIYTPDPDYEGNDQLSYMICDEVCTSYCDTTVVHFIITGNNTVIIPELITPNGDGLNDTWVITNIDKYEDSEVIIMNRWGDKIFVAKPYLNDWAGQSNTGILNMGEKVTDGTYFFVLTLKAGEDPIKGFIELRK